VERVGIGRGVHGDRLAPEFGCGASDANGDLTPIGDKNASKGCKGHGATLVACLETLEGQLSDTDEKSVEFVPMSDQVQRLLNRLDLEETSTDVYVGGSGPGGKGFRERIYGGLVASQAFVAAARTTTVGPVHSMHLYFLRPGETGKPVHYEVERIKDGRNFEVREVRAFQDGRRIFQLMASFTANPPGAQHQDPMPQVVPPDELLNRDRTRGRPGWREQPIDIRTDDPHGDRTEPDHWVWMRPLQPVLPPDPVTHTAVMIFATDRVFMRTSALPHIPVRGELTGASLDHTIWFHEPVDFNGWHLHAMHSPVARHERGLTLGSIYAADGRRVASTAQEAVLRFNSTDDGLERRNR
jgi:acyl-CoA thioesterase-2